MPRRRLVIGRTFGWLLVACVAGCGPFVTATLTVPPLSLESADTTAQLDAAIGITRVLAARHGMAFDPSIQEWRVRRYTGRVQPPDPHDLTLSLVRMSRRANLEYHVYESAATWSPAGDSLRRELEDTLRAHFGKLVSADTFSVGAEANPYVVIPMALAFAAFAPPAGILLIDTDSMRSTSRWPDHFAVRFEAGISARETSEDTYSASSIRAELWRGWLFAEASLDRIAAVSGDWHHTIRVGHLWSPHPTLRTGIVAGYRDADWWPTGKPAFMISLPLQTGSEDKAALRLEPLYVVSAGRWAWAYRFEVDFAAHPHIHPGLGITLRDNVFKGRGALAIVLVATWWP